VCTVSVPCHYIYFVPTNIHIRLAGGTQRLGTFDSVVKADSLVEQLYRTFGCARTFPNDPENPSCVIRERHRHRLEVVPKYVPSMEKAGLNFSGVLGERMEVLELLSDQHPFFLGVQYHPEFTSRPDEPNPAFCGLMQAVVKAQQQKSQAAQ
jgi:CTP synthase